MPKELNDLAEKMQEECGPICDDDCVTNLLCVQQVARRWLEIDTRYKTLLNSLPHLPISDREILAMVLSRIREEEK